MCTISLLRRVSQFGLIADIFYFASHPLSLLRDLWGRGLTVNRLLMFRLSGRECVVKLSGITPLRDDRTP